ncbi:MAG TPA: polysaccharide deacetylase family protein [Gaiellaceae bacterium]|nr:polysaccharide deacetylase family protein [Gaiellaceae bacterium]
MEWPSAGAGPSRDFVGYGSRPPEFRWPDGSGVAVSVVVNYEEGAELNLLDGDGVNDTWGEYSTVVDPAWRDLGTETHFEFGSRVGVWRLARLFDEYAIPVSFGACAVALERNPALCEWLRDRDHEVLGHGYRWTDDWKLGREEERARLRLAIESVERTTGRRVRGWYVRSFPSVNTRELLVEEGGFLYDSDACNDELPYFVEVKGTPFLVVPYTKVFNDNRYFIAPTYATPNDFFENLRLGLDYLLREAEAGLGGRMLTVGIHSRWTGQPNRASALRRFVEHVLAADGACFMRRVDIARFWIDNFGP